MVVLVVLVVFFKSYGKFWRILQRGKEKIKEREGEEFFFKYSDLYSSYNYSKEKKRSIIMIRKKQNYSSNNLGMAFLFIGAIVVLIFASLVFKIAGVIQNSHFDGAHRFTVLMPKEIVSFAPDDKSISVLKFSSNVGKTFLIPIDGKVEGEVNLEKDISSKLKNILFHYRSVSTNMTIIDIARLWFFTKSVPSRAVTVKEAVLPLSDAESDKIAAGFFTDSAISLEHAAVAIKNGTEIAGLGNRLARLITNMGGNVLEVSTPDKNVEVSSIEYYGQKGYTVERLSKILGFTVQKAKNQTLSDITITIGKDKLNSLPF